MSFKESKDREKAVDIYHPPSRYDLQRFKSLLDYTSDLIFITDMDGNIINVNKSSLLKLDLDDISSIFDLIPAEDQRNLKKIISTGEDATFEIPLIKSGGRQFPTEMNINIVKFNDQDYVLILARDITQRKKLEDELKSSLKEKEALLKEIHHRIKNNLQIISSLISLKSRSIPNQEHRNTLKETDDMIKSMALIHEQLYQRDLSKIRVKEYIEKLVKNLLYSHPLQKQIKVKLDIEEITLQIKTAISIGLIVNELVTNALKYAFKGREKGIIEVIFKKVNENFELKVKDDGIGFPKDKLKNGSSFGMKLINMLVKQLDGTLSAKSDNGSCFEIVFKE